MGFLKTKLIIAAISLTLLLGCAKSIMKIEAKKDDNPFRMFGKVPSREFYVPVNVSDSLNLVWENSVNGSFTNSSVSVYDDLVFVNDLSGRVYCFRFDDGKQLGKLTYKGAIYSTPIPFKNLIIFPVAQEKENMTELVYYDYSSGEELEIIELPGRVLTEMIAVEDGVIFNTEIGSVYKYDLHGNKVWETETKVPTRSSPSMKNNLFIFGNDNGEIISLDNSTGDSIYVSNIGGSFFSGSTIVENVIYIGNNNGKLYALNLDDGKMIWEFNSNARIIMTPAVDNENVVFGNLAGYLFSLNRNDGTLNWKTKFRGILNATPLLTENRIVVPEVFFSFHLVDKKDGSIIKDFYLDGRAKYSPVYYKDILFIGYDNGNLSAYEFVE
jgi:outer membrane protein assembly factor BamB